MKFVNTRLPLILLCLLVVLPAQAARNFQIEVTPSGLASVPIAILVPDTDRTLSADFAQGFRDIILTDFEYAGILDVLPRDTYLGSRQVDPPLWKDWLKIGAEFLVSLSLRQNSSGELQADVDIFDITLREHRAAFSLKADSSAYRRIAHRSASRILHEITGVRGFFDTRLAFVSDRGGTGKRVYTMNFDGTGLQLETPNSSININPFWHGPDRLAFTSYVRKVPEVYLKNLRSGTSSLLASYGGTNTGGVLSPDGQQIAVTISRNGNSDIFLLDSRGRMQRQLTHHRSIDVSPAWSPDGREIAFVSDRSGGPQIYKIQLLNGAITRLSFEGRYNTSPSWSPDGTSIAYTSLENNHFNVYTMDRNGYSPRKITGNARNNESPRWSPDGNYLVFTSNRTGEYKLYIMDRTGTFQKRLPDGAGNNMMPDWLSDENEF